MKVAILTTNTLHHAYFVKCLNELDITLYVFEEKESVQPPFKTSHPFEAERDVYEQHFWFSDKSSSIHDYAETQSFKNINDKEFSDAIRHYNPDLSIAFGTRKLARETINSCGYILNLHGGDPQAYRGLDTHLWAIYHGDYDNLKTSLHILDDQLDTGDIVDIAALSIQPNMPLTELRARNTETCVNLCKSALNTLKQKGFIKTSPQEQKGRYYSFMPPQLKELCVQKFANYTKNL